MSSLSEVKLDDNFGPFVSFRENWGFVPNILRAQTLLPRVIEAEAELEKSILVQKNTLPRIQKERIILSVAAALRNTYCVTAGVKVLRSLGMTESRLVQLVSDFHEAGLSESEVAAHVFSLKLALYAPLLDSEDIETLRARGFDDGAILEIILVTALGRLLCTLSVGLAPEPECEPGNLVSAMAARDQPVLPHAVADATRTKGKKGPYLRAVYRSPKTFEPFVFIQKSYGFIPNFFRAQTLRPDTLRAEVNAFGRILLPQDVLTRKQKECILLVVSAANLNSYCVAAHCNMLRELGMPAAEGDQIALDHHQSCLGEADKALLDFAIELGARPWEFHKESVTRLRNLGLSEAQILECVVVAALNNFMNTLQMGLGTIPDFEPRFQLGTKEVRLTPLDERPMIESCLMWAPAGEGGDPDEALLTKAQAGGLDAFEELMRLHSRRVYRTLMAILGDEEEAKDAMQDAFLSAFKHIGKFQRRSKFSTWMISIARNAALQRVRSRKNMESLDDDTFDTEREFRPKQLRDWQDDPEQIYSSDEMRLIVERGIMQLPKTYRVVVMLRDIEQLSTEEVAEELGLSISALKARLFRGRLMLRELLSPHFATRTERASS